MKRILLALAMIVLAGTTAFATTRATWTDTVTVTNNQVQTGTADLQVSTDNGVNWDTSTSVSAFNLTGVIPGPTSAGSYAFSLRNNSGSLVNFTLGGKISAATGLTGGADETKLWIQIYNIDIPAEATAWQTLAQWKAALSGGINFNSTIDNGAAKRYGIKVQLDPTADNNWQGQTVTFTVEVLGTQI